MKTLEQKKISRVCLIGEDGEMYSVSAEELDDFMKTAESVSKNRKEKELTKKEKNMPKE